MRENRLSGSEGGGAKPIVSPYPYLGLFASHALIDVTGASPMLNQAYYRLAKCGTENALAKGGGNFE